MNTNSHEIDDFSEFRPGTPPPYTQSRLERNLCVIGIAALLVLLFVLAIAYGK